MASQYDVVQLNPKQSCGADGSKGSIAILYVRTLQAEDDLDRLFDDVY